MSLQLKSEQLFELLTGNEVNVYMAIEGALHTRGATFWHWREGRNDGENPAEIAVDLALRVMDELIALPEFPDMSGHRYSRRRRNAETFVEAYKAKLERE